MLQDRASTQEARTPELVLGRVVPVPDSNGLHQHNDIEIGHYSGGVAQVIFGGLVLPVPAWRLNVFWAMVPHGKALGSRAATGWMVRLPLAVYLSWQMPGWFTRALLLGQRLIEPSDEPAEEDRMRFTRWQRDPSGEGDTPHLATALEMRARLLRLADSLQEAAPEDATTGEAGAHGEMEPMLRMLSFVADSFHRMISVSDIARAANLHPDYANAVFRKRFGVTLLAYVRQQRLWQAKSLLLTTTLPLYQVAQQSGFGSLSQFHEVFKRGLGTTPQAFRRDSLSR